MMRNKLFTGLVAAAVLFLFAACASNDDGVKEVVFDSADTDLAETVETEEEQEVTEVNAVVVETEEQSSFLVEATAPAGREGKKNYTGWVATSIRPVSNTVGNIKLTARPKQGTFSISVLNSEEKAIPVLSTANEYTTTSFYLKAGKKIVKLCDDSGVVSAAKKTAKGLKLRYTIEKVAVVIIDFECISTKEGYAEDTIKITSTIVSQSKKKNEFALKLLMDTVLGETDRHHFYYSDGSAVKKEVSYYSMKDEKYFTSKNAKASMQIILSGADITDIQSVALANFTTLDTRKWEADMNSSRSFDTVLSYNNSAVGIYWPLTKLEPEQETSSVFYISLAAETDIPGGAAYIEALSAPEEPAEEEADGAEVSEEAGEAAVEAKTEKAASKQNENQVQNIQAVKEEDLANQNQNKEPKKTEEAKAEEPKTEPKNEPKAEPKKQETPAEEQKVQNVAAVEESAEPKQVEIANDKLSVDYIQKLLDKIDALEEGDPEVNKAEINALNAELDAILTLLNAQ